MSINSEKHGMHARGRRLPVRCSERKEHVFLQVKLPFLIPVTHLRLTMLKYGHSYAKRYARFHIFVLVAMYWVNHRRFATFGEI